MSVALAFSNVGVYLPELLTVARNLGYSDVRAFLWSEKVSLEELSAYGATTVYSGGSIVDNVAAADAVLECVSEAQPNLLLGPSTKDCREVAARIAQKMGIGCMNDCLSIELDGSSLKALRNLYGGAYVAVQRTELPTVVTIKVGRVRPERSQAVTSTRLLEITPKTEGVAKLIERRPVKRSEVNLENAEVIVAVGRGFKRREDLRLAEELARELGGEVGCSRPIAGDLKWFPEDRHIGLSGKWVRPKLYVALGISGQMQHVVGIRGSRIIVAVNSDPNAPIHREADYSVVADLYQFVPVFLNALRSRRSR